MKKILFASLVLLSLVTIFSSGVSADPAKLYNGKARWQRLKGARYYIVYYKEDGNKKFNHAVGKLSADTDDFSIKHLIRGKTYWYRVSAIDKFGKEVWITDMKILPEIR